jgi:hypothetical protein
MTLFRTRLWPAACCTLTGLLAAPLMAHATDFQIAPIQMVNGVTIFGTLSTDGTLGPLTPANITAWRVTVRSLSKHVYTPADPGGAQLTGVTVSARGREMKVATSRDGVNDGGLLAFGSFGPGPEHGVQVANFTSLWTQGGVAFYLDGASFEWQDLAAPNGSKRVVARAAPGSPVFKLVPVVFPSGATMTGNITTDGSVGPLAAAQIVSWKINATEVADSVYFHDGTGANSVVLPASMAFSTDGTTLFVARPDGFLGFGVPPQPPRSGAGAVLADFSAGAPSHGQAWWWDAFGSQYKSLGYAGLQFPVATALP